MEGAGVGREIASIWRRVGGALIDLCVATGMLMAWGALAGDFEFGGDGGTFTVTLSAPAFAGYVVTVLAYFIGSESLTGRTLGKLVLGTRVETDGGGHPSWGKVASRNLMRIVDGLPVFYLVGFVAALSNEERQRLGDMAAGTVVVRAR